MSKFNQTWLENQGDKACYLGDGVYVIATDESPAGFVVCTSNGAEVTNLIHIDPIIVDSLLCFVQKFDNARVS